MKNILVIVGSAAGKSSNHALAEIIGRQTKDYFNLSVFNGLKSLPHFDPDRSTGNPPPEIINFRSIIEKSDGIIICTPEYVFSIPGGLKNAIEWCVSTTVFLNKPTGLITASSGGQTAHQQLELIMRTLMAKFSEQTTLLISGVKSKINEDGRLIDNNTEQELTDFIDAFKKLVDGRNIPET